MNEDTDDWNHYLESVLFAINTSIQSATKFTTFRMMFGREPVFLKSKENVLIFMIWQLLSAKLMSTIMFRKCLRNSKLSFKMLMNK